MSVLLNLFGIPSASLVHSLVLHSTKLYDWGEAGNSAYAYFFYKSFTMYILLLQNKKRGRRKGSNKEVSPEIRKKLSEAYLLYAGDKDSEVGNPDEVFIFCDIVLFREE